MHGSSSDGLANAFGDMFSAMAAGTVRQDFAAAADAKGKASPVGLASEVLGPAVHIITTAATVTSDDSLKAFARSQGMDENALSLIFDHQPPANDPSVTDGSGFGLPGNGSGLSVAGDGLAGSPTFAPDLDPALLKAKADAATATSTAAQGAGSLELGPEASLRWTLGQTQEVPAGQDKQAQQFLFGLNGIRAMLPAANAPQTEAAAQAAQVATPESAHQTLAASLILGSAEASQFARRLQMKQLASPKADKPDARFLMPAASDTADTSETDESTAAAEPLVLDTDLTAGDAQLIWQHRQSDGKMNSGQQAGAGGSAPTAERSNIDLRAEQYERLSERLAESLGQRLASQIAKGEWKVEMALHPSELGNIDVKLAMNKGQLEASFSASQPVTQALIADGLPKLKEVLAQLGMEVASMQVNVRQQGQNGGNPTPKREQSGVAGVSSPRGADGNATAATVPAPRSGGITDDGLDLLA
ncbi:MAG: hypothetical protein RL404_374 [Pseudomonadota bacterium]